MTIGIDWWRWPMTLLMTPVILFIFPLMTGDPFDSPVSWLEHYSVFRPDTFPWPILSVLTFILLTVLFIVGANHCSVFPGRMLSYSTIPGDRSNDLFDGRPGRHPFPARDILLLTTDRFGTDTSHDPAPVMTALRRYDTVRGDRPHRSWFEGSVVPFDTLPFGPFGDYGDHFVTIRRYPSVTLRSIGSWWKNYRFQAFLNCCSMPFAGGVPSSFAGVSLLTRTFPIRLLSHTSFVMPTLRLIDDDHSDLTVVFDLSFPLVGDGSLILPVPNCSNSIALFSLEATVRYHVIDTAGDPFERALPFVVPGGISSGELTHLLPLGDSHPGAGGDLPVRPCSTIRAIFLATPIPHVTMLTTFDYDSHSINSWYWRYIQWWKSISIDIHSSISCWKPILTQPDGRWPTFVPFRDGTFLMTIDEGSRLWFPPRLMTQSVDLTRKIRYIIDEVLIPPGDSLTDLSRCWWLIQ